MKASLLRWIYLSQPKSEPSSSRSWLAFIYSFSHVRQQKHMKKIKQLHWTCVLNVDISAWENLTVPAVHSQKSSRVKNAKKQKHTAVTEKTHKYNMEGSDIYTTIKNTTCLRNILFIIIHSLFYFFLLLTRTLLGSFCFFFSNVHFLFVNYFPNLSMRRRVNGADFAAGC